MPFAVLTSHEWILPSCAHATLQDVCKHAWNRAAGTPSATSAPATAAAAAPCRKLQSSKGGHQQQRALSMSLACTPCQQQCTQCNGGHLLLAHLQNPHAVCLLASQLVKLTPTILAMQWSPTHSLAPAWQESHLVNPLLFDFNSSFQMRSLSSVVNKIRIGIGGKCQPLSAQPTLSPQPTLSAQPTMQGGFPRPTRRDLIAAGIGSVIGGAVMYIWDTREWHAYHLARRSVVCVALFV